MIAQASSFVHGQFGGTASATTAARRNAPALRLYNYDEERPVTVVQMHGLRDPAGNGETMRGMLRSRRRPS
jgi:hypothetical protein